MKVQNLSEAAGIRVFEVDRNDMEKLQEICDMINMAKLFPWKVSPARIVRKVGTRGTILGVSDSSGNIVGTALVQHEKMDDYDVGNISHLYIDKEFRNPQNVKMMLIETYKSSKIFDFTYITSNNASKELNRLISSLSLAKEIFKFKTTLAPKPYICWLYTRLKVSADVAEQELRKQYANTIIA